jgi:hypothetical protein
VTEQTSCSITYVGQDIRLLHLFPHRKPELEMMVNFSSNDSLIEFIDLENVEIDLKTVSLSCSEVDIFYKY